MPLDNNNSNPADPRFRNLGAAVVKLTNRCNIRCKYCYEDIVRNGMDMSSEIFQQLVRSILASTSAPRLLLILHGGEPTTLPEEWFEENLGYACSLAKEYGKNLEFSIQSNLVDISDRKLEIFKEFGVGIGGSLDNPDFISESMRPLARKALETFLRARGLGIRIGLLATINQSNLKQMRPFCEWLHSSLQVHHFKVNLAYSVGAGLDLFVPTPNDFFQAQRDIIEFMIEQDGDIIEENLAQEIVRFFEVFNGGRSRSGSLCNDRVCGAGHKIVGITPEGNLLPCGRFAWNDSSFFLGSLAEEDGLSSVDFFERIARFQELNPENWLHCDQCEAKDICGFGCQAFVVRSKLKINIECEPTKLRFAYYQQNIDRLQRLYEKICELEGRPAMSRIDQKLAKLKQLVPIEYIPAVKKELESVLASAVEHAS